MTARLTPAELRDRAVSEKDLLRQVRDLADLFGWETYHPWLSIHSPRGFPDLALCRPPRLVLAELKTERGVVSPPQRRWLELLGACPGLEVYLWRPSDLARMAEVLR